MAEEGLQKKYGLPTAIAMVIGIVIGSGIFFKSEKILSATNGDMPMGILAWVLGGMVMIICAYVFATMATEYEDAGGLVDYAQLTVGRSYSYYIGWFFATTYYPTLASVLAWVAARYTGVLLGWKITGPEVMSLSFFFIMVEYVINSLAPKIAGKIQVSATVIKLIPLFLMSIIGILYGLSNGILMKNFTEVVVSTGAVATENPLFTAVVATAFAYEGWICACSISGELENSKVNLPRALIFGTFFIMIIYIAYYVGLAGAVDKTVLMAGGEKGAQIAFTTIFSSLAGSGLFIFVIISCLGTLNGLMMASQRSFYALAVRDEGPMVESFKAVDRETGIPTAAGVLGFLFCALWMIYFYGANLVQTPWFGMFSFDSSELPIVTVYALYIPMFFKMMRMDMGLSSFKGKVMPFLAIVASLFMIYAACFAHAKEIAGYLIIFAVLMVIGKIFQHSTKKSA